MIAISEPIADDSTAAVMGGALAERRELYVAMPVGSMHGWGVCGKYLTRELARLAQVHLLTEPFDPDAVGGEIEFRDLMSFVLPNTPWLDTSLAEVRLGAPLLTCIRTSQFNALFPNVQGTPNIGYTFFEDNLLSTEAIAGASAFDVVATGSSWCTEVLKTHGVASVHTVLQGVDATVFRPSPAGRELFRDQFVVFSGGKFEFRKGQDLVIRAYKVLQDRHRDVLLINAWFNMWDFSLATMALSPHIRFAPKSRDRRHLVEDVLADNGVDLSRVITLPPQLNPLMARVYYNTDVGLFPNRCEGGTNLVLMEYMACGRPAVVSFSSGHRDVVDERNAILVKRMGQLTVSDHGRPIAVWDDPDLDEVVENLEWAYQHREALPVLGEQAARDMAMFTWKRAAAEFYDLLTKAG